MGRRSGGGAPRRSREGSGGKLTEALRWWLDHGDEWRAAKAAAGDDGDIPEALEPPEILEGLGGWFEDFWRLSTERQIGFGIGAIPASAIDLHTEGWGYEDADMFEHCIREMDGEYLMRANRSEQPSQPALSPREAFRAATASKRGR